MYCTYNVHSFAYLLSLQARPAVKQPHAQLLLVVLEASDCTMYMTFESAADSTQNEASGEQSEDILCTGGYGSAELNVWDTHIEQKLAAAEEEQGTPFKSG